MYWSLLDNNSFWWQRIDFYCSQSTIKSTNSNLLRCGYCPYPVSSFNLDYLNLEYKCNCSFQPNFLTNRNEQELMEICITRLTSAIRETRWLQKQNSIQLCKFVTNLLFKFYTNIDAHRGRGECKYSTPLRQISKHLLIKMQ